MNNIRLNAEFFEPKCRLCCGVIRYDTMILKTGYLRLQQDQQNNCLSLRYETAMDRIPSIHREAKSPRLLTHEMMQKSELSHAKIHHLLSLTQLVES